MQPSAQGIASLFMGNPGALAARVDQDRKQSPMGIPDDLRQLMALNIVTNETDAAKRQQAMNELRQMAPNGQPPTVAESLRQQAVQKLQARMVQEQQRQQALQQMVAGLPATGVPANVPQPQGIDQAPVEFGMASGGIVAFQEGGRGKYETAADRLYRENREEAERQRREEEDRPVDPQAAADRAAIAGLLQSLRGGSETVGRAIADVATMIPRGLVGAYDAAVVRPMRAAGVNASYLSPLLTPEGASPESMTPFTDIERAREAQEKPTRAAPIPTSQGPGDRIVPRYAATASALAPASRRTPPAAGLPAAIAAIAPKKQEAAIQPTTTAESETQDQRLTRQGFINESEAAKLRERADYEREIGRPNTSALDKLMAEYERQKAATESPTGMAGLVEFMSQIAATPRGMSSLEAGAAGARGAQALERERAAQRALLTEKQIGLEQQKLNANREYSKELFGVGKSAYDKMYDQNLKIYQQQGEDFRQASLFAHQKTQADLANQRQIERDKEQHRYAMIQRGTPTAEMEREERRIKMYMDEQKAKGNTVSYMDAVQAVRGLGGNAGLENAQTRMLREARKDIDDRLEQLQMEGKEKTPEYVQLSQQRKRLSDMIVGRVLKEAGVAGDSSGGVDKSNPLLK